jgi:hypothetical protein
MAAKAAGRRVWSGYISTAPFDGKSHYNLARPWSQAEFEVARQCGGTPIAYASGWDDPEGLRRLAGSWRVRLCLDNESAVRPDGAWVQGWLSVASAGHYALAQFHAGRLAAFNIVCNYPRSGDPGGDSWPSWYPRPSGPCGWQWAGSHNEFGVTVDSSWLDDWFGGHMLTLSEKYDIVIKAFALVGVDIVNLDAFLDIPAGRTAAVMHDLDTWASAIADDGHNVADITAQIIRDSRKSGNVHPVGAPIPGPKGDKGDMGATPDLSQYTLVHK